MLAVSPAELPLPEQPTNSDEPSDEPADEPTDSDRGSRDGGRKRSR